MCKGALRYTLFTYLYTCERLEVCGVYFTPEKRNMAAQNKNRSSKSKNQETMNNKLIAAFRNVLESSLRDSESMILYGSTSDVKQILMNKTYRTLGALSVLPSLSLSLSPLAPATSGCTVECVYTQTL